FSFLILMGWRYSHWQPLILFQCFWFQWAMAAIVVALVLFGSVVFTSPAENITISFYRRRGSFSRRPSVPGFTAAGPAGANSPLYRLLSHPASRMVRCARPRRLRAAAGAVR